MTLGRLHACAAVLTLSAALSSFGAYWSPTASFNHSGSSVVGNRDSSPWVQQLRNFKDVLRVETFRGEPTPVPTPTPSSGDGFVVYPVIDLGPKNDPTPPHPLRDYFQDLSYLYANHGLGNVASPLKHAGAVVENLLLKKGRDRFRAARALAAKITSAAEEGSDTAVFSGLAAATDPYARSYLSYTCDDYRAIALAFADSLRVAASNAAANRPLARKTPYRQEPLLLTMTRSYVAGYVYPLVQLVRADGSTAVISAANGVEYVGGSTSSISYTNLTFGDTGSPSPTPTPAP